MHSKRVFKDDGLGKFSVLLQPLQQEGIIRSLILTKKQAKLPAKQLEILKLPQIRLEADQLLAITFMTLK